MSGHNTTINDSESGKVHTRNIQGIRGAAAVMIASYAYSRSSFATSCHAKRSGDPNVS